MRNKLNILKEKAKDLPDSPGCYFFKDEAGRVLYIGKSKCLKKRVKSYFKIHKEKKTNIMLQYAAHIEYICTKTDIEAMLLEYRLIKEYKPEFNYRMAGERREWYINLQFDDIPRFYISPRNLIKNNEILSIGPFFNHGCAETILDVLGWYWQIPICGVNIKKEAAKCMRRHIGQCFGPCSQSKPNHDMNEEELHRFFSGDYEVVTYNLSRKIHKLAEALEFEKAGQLKSKYDILLDCIKYTRGKPRDIDTGNYYVFLKSRHEPSVLWIYLCKGAAKTWMRFLSVADWEENYLSDKQEIFTVDKDDILFSRAVLEIDAIRYFSAADVLKDIDNIKSRLNKGEEDD